MRAKGIGVSILECKDIGNCSNGGWSSRHKSGFLVLFDGEGYEVDRPADVFLELVPGVFGGAMEHVVPVRDKLDLDNKGKVGPMFGGSFVFSSDSRFPGSKPIPIFDRWETPDEYRALSS